MNETRPSSDSETATMYKLKGLFQISELAKASNIENRSVQLICLADAFS